MESKYIGINRSAKKCKLKPQWNTILILIKLAKIKKANNPKYW